MNLTDDSEKRLTESSSRDESVPEVHGSEGTKPGLRAPGGREEFGELLHGLNNVLVSVLLNAQLIEWKLPSYSGMRRSVHEVERSAQRGAVLVNRLKHWLEAGGNSRFQQPQQEEESAGVSRRTGRHRS